MLFETTHFRTSLPRSVLVCAICKYAFQETFMHAKLQHQVLGQSRSNLYECFLCIWEYAFSDFTPKECPSLCLWDHAFSDFTRSECPSLCIENSHFRTSLPQSVLVCAIGGYASFAVLLYEWTVDASENSHFRTSLPRSVLVCAICTYAMFGNTSPCEASASSARAISQQFIWVFPMHLRIRIFGLHSWGVS